ncbi:MAG: HAD-IA family hydrolase [Dehalococcoidia bacterium]|nr:HAD-IA family hydrolase [Dehalococcoidia bacterium]
MHNFMSIRSIFIDFYNTLCYFYPTREARHQIAWRQFGIEMSEEEVRRAYVQGDHYWTLENARFSLQQRSKEEWGSFTADYERHLLRAAGVEVSKGQAAEIYRAYSSQDKRLQLFEDILPGLSSLRDAGLTLGLISNSDVDVAPLCQELGIADYFSFILSSCNVGCEKPHAPIFHMALDMASVQPGEVVHVGDQYHADVVGARAVGITPFLLDRFGLLTDCNDCQHIRDFGELMAYLGLPLLERQPVRAGI